MIDGMAIKKHIAYDRIRKESIGYVDLGSGPADDGEEATEALVIMAVGLKSRWKAAISYHLINKLSSESQAQLLSHAIDALGRAFNQHCHVLCPWG